MRAAFLYDATMAPLGRMGLTRLRQKLMEGLSGRILELGAGTGLLARESLGPRPTVGIDLDEAALERARRRAPGVEFVSADAEALPFPPASFDAVVASLVMCSVPHPERALSEARRVLRPGGELRLLDHVRTRRSRWMARGLDLLTPGWALLSGGCHLNRRPPELVRAAGFKVVDEEEHARGLVVLLRAISP
jgi:ubiquinone/menaquinone biosynthesis C-methylase UbiE